MTRIISARLVITDLNFINSPHFWPIEKNALRTDGPTDRRTDGRTDGHTLIVVSHDLKGEDKGEDGDGLRDYSYCTIDHRTIYYHAFVQHSDDHGLRHQVKLRPLLCTP